MNINISFISGAHVDIKGSLDAPAILGVSNPGSWRHLPGGAGLNSARVAKMLGVDCQMYGLVGDDEFGPMVRDELQAHGIVDRLDTINVHPTGTYTSIVEPNGNLVLALADLKINDAVNVDDIWKKHGRELKKASALFLNTNLQSRELEKLVGYISAEDGSTKLAACTISPAKAHRLKPILHHLDYLFTNQMEARELSGDKNASSHHLAKIFIQKGITSGTISNGSGELIFWHQNEVGMMQPEPLEQISDVTGAGDTLAGAVLAQHLCGETFYKSVSFGIKASSLTLQSDLPYPGNLNLDMF